MDSVQSLVKEPESTALIRFQDCDPFGHLNNARYIDYIFNARQDQLAEFYDFHIFEHGKTHNENWVVSQTQIAYLQPALVMEEVVIKTRLIDFGQSTLLIEAIMLDKARTQPKAVAWTQFTYIGLATGRRATHPDDLARLFGQVQVDGDYKTDGFNQRVETIKSHYRNTRNGSASGT